MGIYNCFDAILQDGNHTDQDAINWANSFCFEDDATEQTIGYARYVATTNGVDVYYDYGADYYFFCPTED